MQLQGLDDRAAWRALESYPVDAIVIDAASTLRGEPLGAERMSVQRIQASSGENLGRKLCLAYLNVGQAEDYRVYWTPSWRAPVHGAPGTPDFMVTVDPDGWSGNYPVAYWDDRWRSHLLTGDNSLLSRILEAGFDGVYLDWVLGAFEPAVVSAAHRRGVDPVDAMVELIAELRQTAQDRRPGFLIVAQNAADLIAQRPELLELVDGVSQEDLSFSGSADAEDWNDPRGGDRPAPREGSWSTPELAARLASIRAQGTPVWTIDYALDPAHVRSARRVALRHGLVPFVSRTPLDALPEPPREAARIEPRAARPGR